MSSPRRAAQSEAEASMGEKPVRYIIQNLERTYGVPENKRASDPLDMLIKIILSQATSDTNSHRTFSALKKRFSTWDAALRARTATIANTIRSGGLANQKAAVIKDVLRQIKEDPRTRPIPVVILTLSSQESDLVRGYQLGTNSYIQKPADRILRRVGLIPQKCTDARAHEIMNAVVPPGKFYSFHVNLIHHGRTLCRPRDPLCERCPIVEYCDYGQELI